MIIQIHKYEGEDLEFDAEGIHVDDEVLELKLGPNGRFDIALKDIEKFIVWPPMP